MRDVGCVDVLEQCFERVQSTSGITLSMLHQQIHPFGAHASRLPHLASRLLERPGDHRSDVFVVQRFKDKDPASRQQRARQLEARVFGRRADQGDDAVLDPGQKGILLPLVEAMDFVAEEDRALPLILQPLLGLLDDLAHARHAFGDRGKRLEVPVGVISDDFGERGFAGPRWAPEDARTDVASADQIPERFARTEEVLLAEELLERFRPHPGGEGLCRSLKQCGLGHDTPSTINFVTKNIRAPVKKAAGSCHPFLP